MNANFPTVKIRASRHRDQATPPSERMLFPYRNWIWRSWMTDPAMSTAITKKRYLLVPTRYVLGATLAAVTARSPSEKSITGTRDAWQAALAGERSTRALSSLRNSASFPSTAAN